MQSRYLIGIDLGTTNSAVSFFDTEGNQGVQQFSLQQLTNRGFVQERSTLPSFCYLTLTGEWSPGDVKLPWSKSASFITGELAREQGALVPTRLISSAKSWLCNSAADRTDRILPVSAEESIRISPVEATRRYLDHMRAAWNHSMARDNPDAEMEAQEVILTVPASFDEVARTLTARAAQEAGLTRVTLLEEPQAAFYEWIRSHESDWQHMLKAGQRIVVCDVGGGTTDFSLIEVVDKDGVLGFQRLAVGDHLLLGGDNMDAFLAHQFAQRFQTEELSPTQWLQLRHEARKAKEALLAESSPAATHTVRLQAAGSRIVAGSLSNEVSAAEVQQLLLDGFFGIYPQQEALTLRKRPGIRSLGLPYEEEASITKHLAHFLFQHGQLTSAPEYILFNGGAMKPAIFQQAIVESIAKWYDSAKPTILKNSSLDLSVSRGATYYGRTRRGLGVRIGGGTPRTYYLKIEVKNASGSVTNKALTLLPRGSEEGASYESDHTFHLAPNRPVSFQLYSSHVRLHDQSGSLIDIVPEEMQGLPPVQTVIRFGKGATDAERIPVRIGLTLTPIGTLALWLRSENTTHRWNLEFQMRQASGQEDSLASLGPERSDELHDDSHLQETKELVADIFLQKTTTSPAKAVEAIELVLNSPKQEWPPSILRAIADTLLDIADKRKTSLEIERRWWNLLGYCLRPGCGYPLDDHRIQRIWKILLSETSNDIELQIQRLILLRRISGGLNRGQQTQLANALVSIKPPKIFKGQDLYQYTERVRTLASFERIDQKLKVRIGDGLLARIIAGQAVEPEYWALGRLATRSLLFASLPHVVPVAQCVIWIEKLLEAKQANQQWLAFPLAQMSRQTDHPEINVPGNLADRIRQQFHGTPSDQAFIKYQKPPTEHAQQNALFGESLPAGLLLVIDV
ncbi:MAG: Hsp70 family protein [Chlamydiales bacterium]|nr:Hsp70 family protein [Chlamydiales bacterium]